MLEGVAREMLSFGRESAAFVMTRPESRFLLKLATKLLLWAGERLLRVAERELVAGRRRVLVVIVRRQGCCAMQRGSCLCEEVRRVIVVGKRKSH